MAALVMAAVPAAAFYQAQSLSALRAAPSTARAAVCSATAVLVADAPSEDYSASHRSFFTDVAVGSSALTMGTLGLEVPQAFADGLPLVSQPAPDFSLTSEAGKDVKLEDLKGRWAVLYFYPGDFTGGCTIEAKNFEAGSSAIRGLGAEIYGVSVDSVDKHQDFGKTNGLSFTLLSDTGGRVSDRYGAALKIPFIGTFAKRQTYLIDPKGILRWVFTDVQSRLNSHVDEVLAKLKELQA